MAEAKTVPPAPQEMVVVLTMSAREAGHLKALLREGKYPTNGTAVTDLDAIFNAIHRGTDVVSLTYR